MKNNFKKASLLLFTIVSLFISVVTVNAKLVTETKQGQYGPITVTGDWYEAGLSTKVTGSKNKNTTFKEHGLQIYSKIKNQFDNGGKTFYYHNITDTERKGVDLYCLDPTLSGNNSLYGYRLLLSDKYGLSDAVKAYDAAVMSVMIDNASYEAKSMAIRALTSLWGFDKGYANGTNSAKILYNTYFGQTYEWISNDEVKADYTALYNKYSKTTFHSLEEMAKYNEYTFSNLQGYNHKDVAFSLFKNALKDALNYVSKENAAKVDDSKTTQGASTTRNIGTNQTEVTKIITHNFNLTNFTKDGNASFILNSVKYKNTYNGVSEPVITGVKVNNNAVSGTFTGRNLLEGVEDLSNVSIEITLEFKGVEENISCSNQPMSYVIDYTYNDTSLNDKFSNYIGIVWESTRTDENHQYQRFISVEKIDGANNGETTPGKNVLKDYNIELRDCNCGELVQACRDTNNYSSSACRELEGANCGCEALDLLCDLSNNPNNANCTNYNTQCSSCETKISNEFQCCDINNKLVVVDQSKIPDLKIEGPSDPALCFVENIQKGEDGYTGSGITDEKGNSYTMTSNKYCAVSCKEDYIMDMPTSQKLNSSRYFTFKMGISGIKTCYTNKIDIEQFNTDMTSIESEMKTLYETYEALINAEETDQDAINSTKSALSSAKAKYDKYISDINSCTTWTNDYKYDPDIRYSYEETYNHNKENMELINSNIVDGANASLWACTGTLRGNQYASCSSTVQTNQDNLKDTRSFTYYDTSGEHSENKVVYTKAAYVKRTATVNANYRPATLFYNVKGSNGRVVEEPSSNTIPIKNGLPVSRLTPRGIYDYKIKITNFGEYYNSGRLGRLAGTNGILSDRDLSDYTNYDGKNIVYNCSYLVNMGYIKDGMLNCNYGCTGDNCDFECIGEGCENICDDGGCEFSCIGTGCIYNEGEGDNYFEKSVTLNNLFPEGTTSRNWNRSSGINGLEQKASKTLDEIESMGESIYESDPILSITITPSSANEIARYNIRHQNDGGYANETLTCYKLGNYENGACFSSFIDEVLSNKYGKVGGLIVNSNYRMKKDLSGRTGEYFEAWSDLSANGINPADMIIGPSWK